MTMKRDHLGRWIPTNGGRTVNIKKARKDRRNVYVGEQGTRHLFDHVSRSESLA